MQAVFERRRRDRCRRTVLDFGDENHSSSRICSSPVEELPMLALSDVHAYRIINVKLFY